jgi:hypothetical protein
MSVIRRHHNSNFTVVPNAIFEDARLSIEAKGVLGYLLSRPHNWTVRLEHVARTMMVGRDKMQRIFNELINERYVLRDQSRKANQQWEKIEYVVFDQPVATKSQDESLSEPQPAFPRMEPQPCFPCAAEPQPAFPCAENTVAYKELKENKTDSTKYSDATASDADASCDVRIRLFNHGLRTLATITGKTPDSCRSLIGKWLKAVNDEAIHVLGAIEDAARNRIADPVPWITRALTSNISNSSNRVGNGTYRNGGGGFVLNTIELARHADLQTDRPDHS